MCSLKQFTVLALISLLVIPTMAQFGRNRKPQPTSTENTGHPQLQAGPMIGYVEMREVQLWVQTKGPANVYFEYYDVKKPSTVYKTRDVRTIADRAFVAKVLADKVVPDREYEYRVVINQQQVKLPYSTRFRTRANWRYRTSPPTLRIALGSTNFVNDGSVDLRGNRKYGAGYEIYQSILAQKPDMMLWLGDNVFYREADWYTQTGRFYRYTFARKIPELQALLAGTSHYAIWDDHDFGPGNSDGTFRDKEESLETFKLFWGNPTYGVPGIDGISTTFERSDVQFFLLDNRYNRTPENTRSQAPVVLGKEQVDWLISALLSSQATFKFVCLGNPFLNADRQFSHHINIAPNEREYLLEAIAREQIKNVVFLTGDRQHTELSYMNRGGIDIYDFTVSPLTAQPYDAEQEPNPLRVRDTKTIYNQTQFGQRNFGVLEVYGNNKNRKLKLAVFDQNGTQVWERLIIPQK
ncbi:MAG: alkaline phosphatase D family protein [Bacteroidota bacterium]